jgi:hypothetical protein
MLIFRRDSASSPRLHAVVFGVDAVYLCKKGPFSKAIRFHTSIFRPSPAVWAWHSTAIQISPLYRGGAKKRGESNSGDERIHRAPRTCDRYPHGSRDRPNVGTGTGAPARSSLFCSAPRWVGGKGAADFTPMWSGQSFRLARELSAKEINLTPCLGNAGDTECPLTFPGA